MPIVSFSSFSRSIVFKVLLVLIFSMTLVVTGSIFIFNNKQTDLMLDWSFNNNEAQLNQIANMSSLEMKQFGERLTLLAKTSEIQSMDPTIAASYLKSYNISSLFISGEVITLYDKDYHFICDNSMVGLQTDPAYPIEFARITPHRPYITPWFRDSKDAPPKRLFGITISSRNGGDGSLVASFSLRRLWTNFPNYTIGKNGFLVAINGNGEILYHPDLKKWMTDVHKISELGLEDINPRNYKIDKAKFFKLNDDESYLLNINYNPTYDFALISFQPKYEIDELISSATQASIAILIVSILIILIIATWMFYILGVPMNKLILHIKQITQGNLDIQEIDVGTRCDEIGQLGKAFNIMHSTIKRQIGELNAHRDILEQEVRERTKDLEEANKKLDLISKTDELTGLPNRRDMNETIANEVGRVQRTHKPFCFIFIDIDHFKNINDTYGHACGDVILKSVAQTIRAQLRKYDVFARYGGEEFLTLLPETDLEGAAVVAERFRKQIEKMTVHYADFTIKTTITLGVAKYDDRLGADRSIQMADKALYQGKASGRNRVIVWKPEWVTNADYEAAAIELAALKKNSEGSKTENSQVSMDYIDDTSDKQDLPS
ncbi:diguanylate cyclase [Fibrobacter sp.]|uniref:sensor domain-containing diguanylate cyclase n=1 Tax=Fibrobacter sp. TaxID=35828 RepID=UPI00262D51A9|nr:diguanylate cyclase [Fibrobacter sp.]MDD5943665.1 diguanylate cyclase [Fibrobacter sp.]